MILPLVGGLAVFGGLVALVLMKKRTAYLGPVKEELQKEKMWLRRGEYNAAMVKGRQNLELLLKLVAEKNGIQLDNTAKAQADAREEAERRNQNSGGKNGNRGGRKKEKKVMTHHQFNRWLSENGYLDRVARWEMNQVRIIGNKAVHENYGDKDDAWNQYNYLEDILKTVTEKSQNPGKTAKRQERKNEERQAQPKVQKAEMKKSGAKKSQGGQKKQKAKAAGEPVKEQKPKKEIPVQTAVAEAPVEQAAADAVKKKRRRRKKKPQNKPSEQAVQNEAVAAEVKTQPVEKKAKQQAQPVEKKPKQQTQPAERKAQPEKTEKALIAEDEQVAVEVVKKKHRRRRKRPQQKQGEQTVQAAQGEAAVTESKTRPAEKKVKTANVPAVEKGESEQTTSDAAKKKRRCRRRKPQNKQSVNENLNNSSGEQ